MIRGRLALRIYLVGLAQFAVVAFGFSTLLSLTRPPGRGMLADQARYVADSLTPALKDPVALETALSRVRQYLHWHIRVTDPEGVVLSSNEPPGAPRCSRPGEVFADNGIFCESFPLQFPGGTIGSLEVFRRGRPPLLGWQIVVIVLVVTGISSLLLARSLTRPLKQLSETARALGEGNLTVRTHLQRTDELGEVARAFDEMAERVIELLRAEKELLAGISHELRTPLARIRVALDLAIEGDAEVARESLMEIGGDLDELERLISDVLTAARLDLGDTGTPNAAPPLRREILEIAPLLIQSETRFHSACPGRPLAIEIHGELPLVNGDPVLLRRVIDNLLENAHKYTEQPDMPIQLIARGRENQVEIEVIDRGIGLSQEDLSRIFRPFFRADRSRTRATGGLGLGLALSRRIIEAHGGHITLESALHQGTCVKVSLPAATPMGEVQGTG